MKGRLTAANREKVREANERPAWSYDEPVSGRHMTYTMGYITRDYIPCMALFAGEDIDPILIPVDILVHGIEMAAEKEQAEAAIAKANVRTK
jgi:hypothetical protein